MLLLAFPSMSVSSLREFPENCVYRHGGFNCFIKYLHRKLLTTNFSLMILKVLKNVHLLDLYIKTTIFLFYNYIHVFNSSQND
jgi:prenyltransferase beta subunit